MKTGRWLAIGVGTLILAMAFWFAVLSVQFAANPTVGILTIAMAILGSGSAFAMYAVAGFSGADNPMGTGFRAAIATLLIGAAAAVLAQSIGSIALLVASPVLAWVIGGSRALAPVGDSGRTLLRIGIGILAVVAMYLLFTVEPSTYALVAPLVALPAIGIADRLYDRGVEIVAEDD